MRRKRGTIVAILAVVAIGAVVGMTWRARSMAAMAHSAPAVQAAGTAGAAQAGVRPGWFGDASTLQPAPPIAREPLAVRIGRLATSTNPNDSYAAYGLISDCMYLQQEGDTDREPGSAELTPEQLRSEQQFCSGLTERMRMARVDYLHKAAEAGVACADMVQLKEGPFGDPSALQTRPEDPLVKAWKTQADELVLRHADGGEYCTLNLLTLDYLHADQHLPLDDAQVLTYGLALRNFHKAMGNSGGVLMLIDAMGLDAHAARLAPDQVAAATAKAQQITALLLAHARRGSR